MTQKNAADFPLILYGLHFEPGVAEYVNPENGKPYRLLVSEETAKKMDPTFARKPVFVHHVDAEDKDLANLEQLADGYVIDSFYNPPDGKHWAKFIVITDEGQQAFANGWKLSNAWDPLEKSAGGQWHGVQYDFEVTAGNFRHMAMVPNPRYESSIILTPDQFKKYNEDKVAELATLKNSKEEPTAMKIFSFLQTDEKETEKIMNHMVELPTKKIKITVAELINAADKEESKEADPKHTVKMKDGSVINVEELQKRFEEKDNAYNGLSSEHTALMDELELMTKETDATKNAEEDKKKENESDEDYEKRMNKKKNEAAEAKKNAEDKERLEKEEKEKNAKKNAESGTQKNSSDRLKVIREKVAAIRNAKPTLENLIGESTQGSVDTIADQFTRGQGMFGSKK